MQKESATNTFNKGLVMDFNPIVLPQDTLCNALNATIITLNGNENVLQNDMGNGRVETAYLPEGYIPLGSAELGGIIYIVSYNPLINKCLIGSFPSPERNITSKESNDILETIIEEEDFKSRTITVEEKDYNIIKSPYLRLIVYDDILNPGDKYLLSCSNLLKAVNDGNSYISAFGQSYNFKSLLLPRYLKFAPILMANNGAYTDMSDTCVWLPIDRTTLSEDDKLNNEGYYLFYTKEGIVDASTKKVDLDEYRDLVTSLYNVISTRSSGLLGILASLECIDSFEVAWDAYKTYGNNDEEYWNFYFFLNWTYNNVLSPDKINLYGIYLDNIDTYTLGYPIWDVNHDNPVKIVNLNYDNSVIVIDNYPHYKLNKTTGEIEGEIECDNTDIMNYQEYIDDKDDYTIVFCTPKYIDSLDSVIKNQKVIIDYSDNEAKPRLNNDSDNLFLLSTPYSIDKTPGFLEFDLTPMMPFGMMDWFKLHFIINLDKLGSGEIDLSMYRYYIDNNTITLLWGLDAYPERNKKINSVTFTYYPIKDKVYDWLENNAAYIDSYKGMSRNNCWVQCESEEKGESYQSLNDYLIWLEDTTEYYSYVDDNKTTYSGNFSDTLSFDNLTQYTTYLVLIRVNYDGDFIDFYRIMYTEPIFNNVFYQYEDFSEIVLSEVTDFSFIGNKISGNSISSYYEYKTEYEAINSIPSYITTEEYEKLDNDKTITYYAVNRYDVTDFAIEIEGSLLTSKNIKLNSFNIDINLDEPDFFEADSLIFDLNYNVNPVSFSNSGTSSTVYNIKEIQNSSSVEEWSTDKNIITIPEYIKYEYLPILILYNNYIQASISKKFTKLEYDVSFIMGTGGPKFIRLELNYQASGSGNNVGYTLNSDDEYVIINTSSLSEIKANILNLLSTNDFICVGCMMYANLDKKIPGENYQMTILWGAETKPDQYYWAAYIPKYGYVWYSDLNEKYGRIKPGENNSFILLYAIKDESNNLILYTYGITKSFINNNQKVEFDWNGYDVREDVDYFTGYASSRPVMCPIFIYDEDNETSVVPNGYLRDEVINFPFENLYKLKSDGSTIDIYEYTSIYYYPKFEQEDIIIIKNKIKEMSVLINTDVDISNLKNINNFSYDSPEKIDITYTENRVINIEDIIYEITSKQDQVFISYEDENGNTKIIYENLSDSYVYKYSPSLGFSQITLLPNINGELKAFSPMVRNGYMYTKSASYSNLEKATIGFGYEEQAIYVKGIYIVPIE